MKNVYKSEEYRAFLKMVKKGKIPANWQDVAEAIGVHPNTITAWRKLPEFQEALSSGIQESIEKMSNVGKRDWRMWRERYAMLTKEANKQNDTPKIVLQGLIQINVQSD